MGLALEGDPGIGKTTLWRQAIAGARGRGYAVLATAPAEPDSALAFAGLADLFEALPEPTLDAVPADQRRAVGAVTAEGSNGPERDEGPVDPQVLARATLVVLRASAPDGPTLVALHDEQWLDGPSADALVVCV